MSELIYGTDLRISECMTLHVKDIDFEQRMLIVRSGKGNKDRVTIIPERLTIPLQHHLLKVDQLHKTDVLQGNGYVPMPNALYKKYPSASRSLGWQFVFPSSTAFDPGSAPATRHDGIAHRQHYAKLFGVLSLTLKSISTWVCIPYGTIYPP